ncbi:MAG: sensor histidine kinase [Nitrosopumilus sp.]|uniref:sensor histidine kinase n=1 Tax=Nitrosopumilus sp. TaxID=2024843 RepID=UPI00243258EC|nr:sensor histidine kinase [Nitrosopumilus sp.]MCV0366302.1 sensor histidine kinase [Nitrosopumilus sp.]
MKTSEVSKNFILSSILIQDFDKFVKKRIDDFSQITKAEEVQQALLLSNQEFKQLLDVDSFLSEQDKSEKVFQSTPFIERTRSGNLSNELKEIIEFYKNVYEHNVIDELFITNQFGANVALGIGTSDYRQDDEEWWQITKTKGVYIDTPVYNENYNAYTVPIGLKITDESGNFIGVLRISLNLEDILEDLKDDSEILSNDNKNVYIIDNSGTIVYSNQNKNLFYDKYKNFELITGKTGSFDIVEDDITKFIAYSTSTGYLDFSGFGWVLLIEQDELSILEDVSDVQKELIIITLGSIVVAGIIGIIIIYLISTPLNKITKIASQFSKGDLTYKLESSKFSEFQVILNSFKDATHNIKQLIETEKELAESQARVKNERLTAMGELSSSLAHDLKNPLAVIKTGVDAIKKNFKNVDPQFQQEVFPRMENAITRMTHQINDVLNYVRITPTNLQKYSLLKIINFSINSLNIPPNVTIQVPSDDIVVYCDREKTEIVFINMILNAIQSIDKKYGNIIISFSRDSDNNIIQIQDDGEEIPDENLKRVFLPLFTTKMKGTGLGLSICKNIIEQHGWSIEVYNKPTRFLIKIPRKEEKV